MTAKTFLDNFGHMAEAPNGITKLRQLILQLAVTGKLVPQDPKDEPAVKLLEKIGIERESNNKVIQYSELQTESNWNLVAGAKGIPTTWVNTTLATICGIKSGNTLDPTLECKTGIPYLKVADMNIPANRTEVTTSTRFIKNTRDLDKFLIPSRSIIFPKRGGAIATNKKQVVRTPIFADLNIMAICCPQQYSLEFLSLWFNSFDLSTLNSGTSVPQINHKDLAPLTLPVPPLPEQHRIVAKVDELMKLCDELEEQKKRKAETRAAATKAALSELTTVKEPKLFSKSWQRISDHFNIIFDTPETVKDLRQAILQLAVTGKLVPQDPKDEPADLESYTNDGLTLPKNWRAVTFNRLFDIHGGNQPPKSTFKKSIADGYVRLIQIRDLGDKPQPVFIKKDSVRRFCSQGDILIGRYGASVGKIFVSQLEGAYNVALAKVEFETNAIEAEFTSLVLRSRLFQEPLARISRSAQAGFNKGDLAKIVIPLPPLPEQHRIVAKVDEMMKLCDELETQLRHSQSSADQLFDAVVSGMMKQ